MASNLEEEYSDDEYHDSQTSFDIFKLSKVSEKIIWEDHDAWIFRSKRFASEIVSKLDNWNYNRYLDQDHMNKIKISLLEQRTPILFGDIHLVMDNHYRCLVINGQHRLKAISEILNDDPNYDILLDFMIIKLNKIDNIMEDNKTNFNLIEKIYNIINMSYKCSNIRDKEIFALELAVSLANESELKKGIVKKTKSSTTRKPKISIKELKDYIIKNLPDDYQHIKVSQFVKQVKLKNKEFSLMDRFDIYHRQNPAQNKINQYEKARVINFYLNLDGMCHPDNWIKKCL